MLEKKVITWHGKKHWLIGADNIGQEHYLEEASFDCDWYWGWGYVHVFSNQKNPSNSADILEHWHFSKFFEQPRKNCYDVFKEFFKETVLADNEIWLLIDYMYSFYTLKKSAELFHSGNSHYTSKASIDELKNPEIEEYINTEAIPAIIKKVDILLGGKE